MIAISQGSINLGNKGNADFLENTYMCYYGSFGVKLFPVPNVSTNIGAYFDSFPVSGIVLTGGNDVNPELYGEKNAGQNLSYDRDKTEMSLIGIAIKRNLPLFGTCRGAQLINVYFGGKLMQDLKHSIGSNHVSIAHKVRVVDEKALKLYGKKEFTVNSYHNHGINKAALSKGLMPFAVADDGTIEGIFHPNHKIAAVMWHPERKGSDRQADKKLIEAFLNRKLFWKKR